MYIYIYIHVCVAVCTPLEQTNNACDLSQALRIKTNHIGLYDLSTHSHIGTCLLAYALIGVRVCVFVCVCARLYEVLIVNAVSALRIRDA